MTEINYSNILPAEDQREVTRLCVETGLLLMQHGAESALVENLTRRMGGILGVQVEVAIMANAITVTTLCLGKSMTTVRRNEDRGISMHMVTEVQRLVLDLEAGTLGRSGYRKALEAIKPFRYPRWLVSLMIGLSCACFAGLAGIDWHGALLVFAAAGVAMYVRLHIAHFHFNPLINFFVASFVATSISIQGVTYRVTEMPKVAMAASVLLLVPGFPLINGISDMVKGYMNTGVARLCFAVLLAGATCAGIMLAMRVWNVWGWV